MKPKVTLLTCPAFVDYEEWLQDLGVSNEDLDTINENLLRVTGAEKTIILAAKRCYKSFVPGLNPNVKKVRHDPEEYMLNILKSGHGSVLEHANATFAFEGVSRVFTHELVRHRAGCAYSQESLRYVKPNLKVGSYFTPSCLVNEEDVSNFDLAMSDLQSNYNDIAELYLRDDMPFSEKKEITSALRRVLPMGMPTGIVATFNFRALRHIIEMRTSIHAEEEIRVVFNEVADICREHWPLVFQDMRVMPDGVIFECGAK